MLLQRVFSKLVFFSCLMVLSKGAQHRPNNSTADLLSGKTQPRNISSSFRSLIVGGLPSRPRKFYVHARVLGKIHTCGGAIIAPEWVITAANCFHTDRMRTHRIVVEIGDFSRNGGRKLVARVSKIIVNKWFEEGATRKNDIALLKLTQPVSESYVIRLCGHERRPGTLVGTCGLGSTSTRSVKPAGFLQETLFYTSSEPRFPHLPSGCPEDTVCVKSVFQFSNVCAMDEGNPLYTFECDSTTPQCLYGVTSYYRNKNFPYSMCDEGSFFASIHHLYEWIHLVMETA